jgi:hypothetical protein
MIGLIGGVCGWIVKPLCHTPASPLWMTADANIKDEHQS